MPTNAEINKEIRRLKKKWSSIKISENHRNKINVLLLELEEVRKTLEPKQKKQEKSKEASRRRRRKKQNRSLQTDKSGFPVDISATTAYEEKAKKLLQEIRKIMTNVEEDNDRNNIVQKLKLYR